MEREEENKGGLEGALPLADLERELEGLRARVLDRAAACTRTECPLNKALRQLPKESRGILSSRYVLVGEAPGRISVQNGKPFSGPGGRLLREMLKVAARRYDIARPLELEDVFYITDTVKCWPGDGSANRPPDRPEWMNCAEYLRQELSKADDCMVLIAGYRNAERIRRALGLESVDFHKHGWQGYGVHVYRFQHPSPINPYAKTLEYKVHVADLFSKVLVRWLEEGGGRR